MYNLRAPIYRRFPVAIENYTYKDLKHKVYEGEYYNMLLDERSCKRKLYL